MVAGYGTVKPRTSATVFSRFDRVSYLIAKNCEADRGRRVPETVVSLSHAVTGVSKNQ
jgi:hypothetical protein